LALEGVARKVPTPVPSPETPVEIGKPVQFVNVPEAGVPRTGVTRVGEVARTRAPVPVSSVTAAARLALEGVAKKVATPVPRPLIPLETGKPVQLVRVPELGVPRAGVTSVGLLERTTLPDPVSSVTMEAKLALEGVAKNVATPAARPLMPVLTGKPEQLVRMPTVGVPREGVIRLGELANTSAPEPVSSLITPLSSREVVEAN
jgi:hypothetical protein